MLSTICSNYSANSFFLYFCKDFLDFEKFEVLKQLGINTQKIENASPAKHCEINYQNFFK